MSISLQTAGAGAGKTHSISEEIAKAVGRRDNPVPPEAIIATTFTEAAAGELRERIRGDLFKNAAAAFHEGDEDRSERLAQAAGRIDLAAIGTVHGFCLALLERFSLEAGLSPEIRVIEERESERLLAAAIDKAIDHDEQERLITFGTKLGQSRYQEGKGNRVAWREQIRSLVNLTRCNNLSPDDLPAMGEASWKVLKPHLAEPDPGYPERFQQQLERSARLYEKERAQHIEGGGKDSDAMAKYCDDLQKFYSSLQSGDLDWSTRLRIGAKQAGPASVKDAAEIPELAQLCELVTSHPDLHRELHTYLSDLFTHARDVLRTYAEAKKTRGCLDFSDLEQQALTLLRNRQAVSDTLRSETRLLVVDEFQDTNPIQLAIFLELTECADETLWVGDIKQAIYGFRDSDPELIREVSRRPDVRQRTPLKTSYRSAPDIVHLTNAIFTPAFTQEDCLDLPEDQIRLNPNPKIAERWLPDTPAIGFLELDNTDPETRRRRDSLADAALADAVLAFLAQDPLPKIFDKDLERHRDIRPGDIAILARTGSRTRGLAAAFHARGTAVSFAKPGLLATPEATLALACLHRLADPGDQLAAAQIIALAGSRDPEDWLPERIAWLRAGRNDNPPPWGHEHYAETSEILRALDSASDAHEPDSLSPAGVLDLAIGIGDVAATARLWGPDTTRASARLANLEQLRGLASDYENECASVSRPATLGGLVGWLDDLADKNLDELAARANPGAINILTYHGAKGLQWPVVYAYQLDWKPRSRIWDARAITDNDAADPEDPLAGRSLQLLLNPFGTKSTNDPVSLSLSRAPVYQAANDEGLNEEKRLLYVGLTRPQHHLFFVRTGSNTPFLDNGDISGVTKPGWEGSPLETASDGTIEPSHEIHAYTPPKAEPPTEEPIPAFPRRGIVKLKADLRATRPPSSEPPTDTATRGKILLTGAPRIALPQEAHHNSEHLGNAFHIIFAAGILRPGSVDESQAAAILEHYQLQGIVTPAAILQSLEAYLKFLHSLFTIHHSRIEVPFSYRNPQGQRLTGYIDHLLETPDGSIIIDHKTSRADDDDARAEKALSYSGQLRAYRDALPPEQRGNLQTWIHFPLTGHLVEVRI